MSRNSDIEKKVDSMKISTDYKKKDTAKDIPINDTVEDMPIVEVTQKTERLLLNTNIDRSNIYIPIDKTQIEKSIESNMLPDDITVTDLDLQTVKTQTSLDRAFTELYNEISLEKKTEFLKNDEIKILGTLYSNAKYYGFLALQERIIKHMQMRISLNRKGRTEAVDIVKAERQHEEMKTILDKYTRQDTK